MVVRVVRDDPAPPPPIKEVVISGDPAFAHRTLKIFNWDRYLQQGVPSEKKNQRWAVIPWSGSEAIILTSAELKDFARVLETLAEQDA